MSEPAAWATIERLITVKAATQGATDIFWISAVLFLMLIALVWLTKPSRSSVPADAGGAH
jgi:DHA2 family multidrug resistance protein